MPKSISTPFGIRRLLAGYTSQGRKSSTEAEFQAKKTCASAQVGARDKYEKRTEKISPINTSGILIVVSRQAGRQSENAKELT
jgi:hypothetical protein